MINIEEIRRQAAGHSLVREIGFVPKGHLRVETGFVYPDGTSIEVFVVDSGNGRLKLSDLGQTSSWLLHLQIKPWLSKKREAMLSDALALHGVSQVGGALEYPLDTAGSFADGVVRLSQACLRAADLCFTRRNALQTVFKDQVEETFSDLELDFEQDVDLVGRTTVRVDYLVRTVRLTSAILTLSSGSASSAHVSANEVFRKWYDLAVPSRPEARITLWDDGRDVYKSEDLERLSQLSSVVPFSDRQALRDLVSP